MFQSPASDLFTITSFIVRMDGCKNESTLNAPIVRNGLSSSINRMTNHFCGVSTVNQKEIANKDQFSENKKGKIKEKIFSCELF